MLSTEEIRTFKPPARAYHWACQQLETPADRVALVAAHSWDVHGAVRAGLIGALATRLEGAVPAVVTAPHVAAARLDEVVDALLALPDLNARLPQTARSRHSPPAPAVGAPA